MESSDTTYIAADERWLYLAVVMSFTCSATSSRAGARSRTCRRTWLRTHWHGVVAVAMPAPSLIFHSDRSARIEAASSRMR